MAYAERIKLLYITALALRGDSEKGAWRKEKHDNVYRNLIVAADTVCADVLYNSAGDFGIGGLYCLVD